MQKLSFPLYHGTSTLFEDKIKKYGLGGYNIIKELMVIEFLSELDAIANNYLKDIDDWKYRPENKDFVAYIVSQRNFGTNGGMNFQHGELYLTTSKPQAQGYANSHKYGSEAISTTFRIMDLIVKNNIPINEKSLQKYSRLIELKNNPCSPIVYEIVDLPYEFITSGEKGEAFEELILKIVKTETHSGELITKSFRAKSVPFELLKLL